jgi:3-hydroxyacyl-CoA dehydrogenase/enoyl-CoA hydratase/3-hydroxybutyryl-CoA epimerase
VKADATRKAEAVLGAGAILGTNTSTLPITGLAEASVRPESFIGMHFFSPVDKMPLVEVIRGRRTSDATLARTLDLMKRLGKTPIVVNDSRGFYTSRVFGTYITEGCTLLREGVRPALIENAGRMSGMPMPPLGLADEVGLGLMHSVKEQTRRDLAGEAIENPSAAVLDLLVGQLGRTGKRAGKGFYDHAEDGTRRLWPGLAEHFAPAAEQPTAEQVIQRFLYVQALEAARCMDEGILAAPEDADVGAVLGWGFAPYTGGPLSFIDTIGTRRFVAEADRLAAAHGPRFSPPKLLRELAARDATFYPSPQ